MKRSTVLSLEEKLWKIFSLYIRKKYSIKGEYVKCYTCGAIHPITEVDAGHYEKRQKHATKFDERNVRPQCQKCNRFQGGKQEEFALKLEKEYGYGILQELNQKANSYFKFTEKWLEDKILYYKEELKKL